MLWTKLKKFFKERFSLDRKTFSRFVYFGTIDEAVAEIKKRKTDKELQKKIENFYSRIGIPNAFKNDPPIVIGRHIATPNFESARFLIIADALEMRPLFLEYHEDKFTSSNAYKKTLVKLPFHEGIGKKGGLKLSYKSVMDINKANGKTLKSLKTDWGENLIDFHHNLFTENYPHINKSNFYDGSDWFKIQGEDAKDYYIHMMALFISNGILLENYVLEDPQEQYFAKNILLPTLKTIYRHFKVKPLIVALSPTDVESLEFWSSHNHLTKSKLSRL